jgi:LmbE family N-acetylglucosaminyl deacetylase
LNQNHDLVLEEWKNAQPSLGKVFAAVFPHSDDFSIFAAGLMAKLVQEGYTGYFIRTTNDEKDSHDLSIGETICRIEQETCDLAKVLGIRKVYDFNYKNHYLAHDQLVEIRHRLITLFRFLKVDTVISFDPWAHNEENPDHYITGMAVEQACWMAGRRLDLPELEDLGLEPKFVTEKYYCVRDASFVNRVIDISRVVEKKYSAVMCNKTPLLNMWHVYQDKLKGSENRHDSLESFCRSKFVEGDKEMIEGVGVYEAFHYIAPTEY